MLYQFSLDYPHLSFGLCLCALALPFVPVLRNSAALAWPRWMRWYRTALIVSAIAWAATASARYLAAALPYIEGVDFFFYLCVARDFLHGAGGDSLAKYGYFPGGYRYWEAVMALFGEDLATLQFAVAGTLVANAVLCGLIVARSVKSLAAGALAAPLYLMLASCFEALQGTTEPIATLFALAGVLAWGGLPLRGVPGWRRALLLGLGLGLAAWTKQQGGLVAIGAGILVISWAMHRPGARDSLWQILAVGAAATCVFLIALLLEGRGLAPLRIGLGLATGYEAEGSLTTNLPVLARQAGAVTWLILLAAFIWLVMLGSAFATGLRQDPWVSIVGFCLLAALATTAQFSKRAYLHYALLAAPFFAIVLTIMAARLAQAASTAWPRMSPFIGIATAGVLVASTISVKPVAGHLQVWPPAWNPVVSDRKPWHQSAEVAADLQALRSMVAPGEQVLVLPPRRNVIHFLLGSRPDLSPAGYGWGKQDLSQVLLSPQLDAVLVLDRRILDDVDAATCRLAQCGRAIAALPASGFRTSTALNAMTLWRRSVVAKTPVH